jgi:lipoate-protein ligase A
LTLELVSDGCHDGPTNMARDRALIESLAKHEAVGRIYAWSGPWISLGAFQREEREILAGCAVPTVRRPTGGKAVLHGHDLTLGLAARLGALLPDLPAGLRDRAVKRSYRALAAPLVAALRACGLDAALAEETPFARGGDRTGDCFAHVSPNDIVDSDTGIKVCGCALSLAGGAVLLQASIPCGEPLVDPATVFPKPHRVAAQTWDRGRFAATLLDAWRVLR